ncbi:MAG: dihydroneopterin aldolase [candidate division Zixibacteria bacterium]|nr:dihydroneopterin aldolase [candidate division Zixibacteria bacterium]
MNRILIKNIKLYGHCGTTEAERTTGALYEIDAAVYYSGETYGIADDIEHTVDYTELYGCIADSFQNETYKLIESAAERIADAALKRFNLIDKVEISLRKRPPFDASLDYVEVRITRERKNS